jgi:hypothetical protein
MSSVLNFNDFLNEKAFVAPEIAIAQSIAAQNEKIASLKKEMMEKPEQRDFILAKINVELEKIDSLQAKKNLLTAKEFEEQRKEREKAQKLRDKAAAKRKQ